MRSGGGRGAGGLSTVRRGKGGRRFINGQAIVRVGRKGGRFKIDIATFQKPLV